jgi:SAM-dependent methyltransferase
MMDKHDLYELCVQSPRHAVQMLRAIHGGDPRVLAEDFCGTAGVSREWCAREGCAAIATDIDAAVLERAAGNRGVRLVCADVREAPCESGSVDVVFVGNFSIGEIHDRRELVRYLAMSRTRLRDGGVFVCDTYGGESAYRPGGVTRTHVAADGSVVEYTWEQRRADPATAMVENALHFRVRRGGEMALDLPDAFVYRWRLWAVPELRDAMTEAGFAGTSVHQTLDAEASAPLASSFIVCVAGRNGT